MFGLNILKRDSDLDAIIVSKDYSLYFDKE